MDCVVYMMTAVVSVSLYFVHTIIVCRFLSELVRDCCGHLPYDVWVCRQILQVDISFNYRLHPVIVNKGTKKFDMADHDGANLTTGIVSHHRPVPTALSRDDVDRTFSFLVTVGGT